jgi:hypothetical protein
MPTVQCVICNRERELAPFEQPAFWCSDECQATFEEIIDALQSGSTCAQLGVDPNSRLGRRAISEALRLRYRELRARYDQKSADYAASQPSPGDRSAIWRRYFT